MSKRDLTVFMLEELAIVRVVCRRVQDGKPCGGAVEMPLSQLGRIQHCPVCRNEFGPGTPGLFSALPRAVEQLTQCHTLFGVELVVPTS